MLMIVGLIFLSFMGTMWTTQADSGGGAVGFFSPQLIGVGLLSFGFILLIAGIAASSEKKNQGQPIVIQAPTPYMTPQPIPQNAPSVILAICPNCKMRIPAESKFCPECGYVLQAVPSADQVHPPPWDEQPSQPSDIPQFCENCGAPREDGNFCKKCGTRLA